MSFGRIKLDRADVVFSEYIRRRDRYCVRCGARGDGKHGIVGLQNSHFFGRKAESTRFDPENCDTLCPGCHQYWGSDNREDYRVFKLKQLGEPRFYALMVKHNQYQKRDRVMALLQARALLKELEAREISERAFP